MQLRIFTEPQQGASYDDLLAVAATAEALGFDAFFRSDHYIAFSGDGLPGPTDAWITLAGLARDTSRIRLGTLVSPVTFRQPGPLALSVAQVDVMSGGRVELGLGAGWNEREHRAYGLDWPETFGERFSMLEEQLEIVTGMWATEAGSTFSYSGNKYVLDKSPALPKPMQRPGPPIVIGGGGAKRTPALAARFGAEYNTPFLSPAAAGEAFGRVRAACEAIDRDPSTITFSSASTVCCGANEAEVERRATAIGRTAEQARKGGVGGTPDEVVAKLQRYADAGAQRVYLQVLDLKDLDHLRLIANEVMPHLA
jgi:alkanesulfonate monooxygenase